MSSASKMVPEEVAGSSRGVRKCSSGGGVRASTSRKNGNMSLAINAVAPVLNKMYVIRTLDIIENRDAVRVVARLRDEETENFLMIYLPANIAIQYLADQEGFEEHYKALEIIEFSADNVVEAVNMLTLEDIGAKIKQEMEEAIDPIPEDIPTVEVPEEYRHSTYVERLEAYVDMLEIDVREYREKLEQAEKALTCQLCYEHFKTLNPFFLK